MTVAILTTAQVVKTVAVVLKPNQPAAAGAAGPSEVAVTPMVDGVILDSAFSKIYSLLLTVFGPSPVLKTIRPS